MMLRVTYARSQHDSAMAPPSLYSISRRMSPAESSERGDKAMTFHEVYDTQTRNLLLDTETLAEALAIVRATVSKHGPESVATWLLVEDDDTDAGNGRRIASGDDLARLATATARETATPHDD
jgi:hypothetical protein